MDGSANDVLVRVEHVSRKFCKSLKRSLWYGLQDTLAEFTGGNRSSDLRPNEFWAVSDVSFELRRGECLGLIGRNGAGKSTLLKMLCGLIKPDAGRIEMHGRVCALIELSAGFNPILTGRENIHNRGAILGLTKTEIDRKFDAIVEFAEVEEFLDAPVQNYSSGMKVRLGFAVSAQMEPDLLIIDEVLAVGDLGFVIKCLNQMADIIPGCATIFVSHSMPMIARICTHALLMDAGRTQYLGIDIPFAIEQYIQQFETGRRADQGSGGVVIGRVGLRANEEASFTYDNSYIHENGSPLQVRLEFRVEAAPQNAVNFFILILDQQLREAVNCLSRENTIPLHIPTNGGLIVEVRLPNLYLNQGRHTLTVGVEDCETNKIFCRTGNAFTFLVRSRIQSWGTCVMPGEWRCRAAG